MPDRSTPKPWELRFGASVREGTSVEFRVWAPNLTNLAVRVMNQNTGEHPRTIPLTRSLDSEFVATVSQVSEGADYIYVLDGERERPDPVSRWQPGGVHGFSRIVDPRSFPWSDQGWSGIPL
jgi:maltooligosyltrehalose trehalohydrolase